MSKSVDTGTPPKVVRDQQQQKKEILENTEEESVTIKTAQVKQSDHVPEIGFTPAPKVRTFEAILTHDLYKLTLEILDISISDFQIALKIPRTGFKFEPIPQSSYVLKSKGKEHVVTYLGGLFDFPTDEHWTITFLIEQIQETPINDKILQAYDAEQGS